MSLEATQWTWELRLEPCEAKLVLLAIANSTDPEGRTSLNFPHLAAMCCMSVKRVERVVLQLVAMDLITRDPIWKFSDGRVYRGIGPRQIDPKQRALPLFV